MFLKNIHRDRNFIHFREKFHSSDFGFSVTTLLDCLEDPIRKLYDLKLSQRECEDEFDSDDIFASQKLQDRSFYLNSFYPAALLYTYEEIHKGYKVKDLWNDVFTLGFGSKTRSLEPETNGVCHKCVGSYFPNLESTTADEISRLNIEVFLAQKANNFPWPSIISLRQSLVCMPSRSETEVVFVERDNAIFNPFSTAELDTSARGTSAFNPFSESSESEDENQTSTCIGCRKSFSNGYFLLIHNNIFHKNKVESLGESPNCEMPRSVVKVHELLTSRCGGKKVKPTFVSDGEDIITSFHSKPPKKKARQAKKRLSF